MATISCDGSPSLTAACGETLEAWIKPLQMRLAGATYGVIKCELQAAVRDFYLRSLAWRDTVGPYPVDASEPYIYLNPVDQYANVQHVIEVYLQYDEERKRALNFLTRPPVLRRSAEPDSVFCAEPATLQLSPVTNVSLGRILYVYAALVPPNGTERLPQIAVTHHFEAIMNGALSRLHGMRNKPWTDFGIAADARRQFSRAIAVARDAANRGNAVTDTPFRFPPFA